MPVYTSQNLTVTDSQQAYLHPGSYKSTSSDQAKRIKRLIKILVDIVTPPFDHAYIRHQWEKHGNVPLGGCSKSDDAFNQDAPGTKKLFIQSDGFPSCMERYSQLRLIMP